MGRSSCWPRRCRMAPGRNFNWKIYSEGTWGRRVSWTPLSWFSGGRGQVASGGVHCLLVERKRVSWPVQSPDRLPWFDLGTDRKGWPEEGKVILTLKARGEASASILWPLPIVSQRHCHPGLPPPLPAPVSPSATVKVSGWPEPDRTGHRLGRVKRKRRGAIAPPPVQQARLRERERERRATYAVCIAERAGGGARAGRLGSARAGLGRSSPAPV